MELCGGRGALLGSEYLGGALCKWAELYSSEVFVPLNGYQVFLQHALSQSNTVGVFFVFWWGNDVKTWQKHDKNSKNIYIFLHNILPLSKKNTWNRSATEWKSSDIVLWFVLDLPRSGWYNLNQPLVQSHHETTSETLLKEKLPPVDAELRGRCRTAGFKVNVRFLRTWVRPSQTWISQSLLCLTQDSPSLQLPDTDLGSCQAFILFTTCESWNKSVARSSGSTAKGSVTLSASAMNRRRRGVSAVGLGSPNSSWQAEPRLSLTLTLIAYRHLELLSLSSINNPPCSGSISWPSGGPCALRPGLRESSHQPLLNLQNLLTTRTEGGETHQPSAETGPGSFWLFLSNSSSWDGSSKSSLLECLSSFFMVQISFSASSAHIFCYFNILFIKRSAASGLYFCHKYFLRYLAFSN